MSRYIAESITTDAGHFGHVGLCQTGFVRSWHPSSVVIDSATYLLTIGLPDIDNIALSLYDISTVCSTYLRTASFYPLVWTVLGSNGLNVSLSCTFYTKCKVSLVIIHELYYRDMCMQQMLIQVPRSSYHLTTCTCFLEKGITTCIYVLLTGVVLGQR